MMENIQLSTSQKSLESHRLPPCSASCRCSAFPTFQKLPPKQPEQHRVSQDLIPPRHCHLSPSPLCKDRMRGNSTHLPSGCGHPQEAPSQGEILGITRACFVKVRKSEFSYRIKVSQPQQHGMSAVRSWEGKRWETAHCCMRYKGLI